MQEGSRWLIKAAFRRGEGVSHRLAGMGEGATLAIMAKTMRETDMFG
jgi:hypothetical protein